MTQPVRCCIVGGGPAGMMLGFLLARAGVEVAVLEKHADFLRDFRGDTIHPSTLQVIYELGLLDELLKLPHDEVPQLTGWFGNQQLTIGDFSHLPTHCKFIMLMPQWDFLAFLAKNASPYPSFHLIMQANVNGLIELNGKVCGVRAETPNGPLELRADLVIGADGRHSIVRKAAGLIVKDFGAPMDVLWMRLSRRETDPSQTFGRFDQGKGLVMLNRRDYWQCGYVIPKGASEEIHRKGLPAFQQELARLAPFLNNRVTELRDWEQVKLLTVVIDRLKEWSKPGFLCIGDAAHAMSPVGGVGINLAIQDAIAAANILTAPLKTGTVSSKDLKKVQDRRIFPTVATQKLQILAQNNLISPALSGKPVSLPWFVRALKRWPILARIPARIIGIGFRPEHVQ